MWVVSTVCFQNILAITEAWTTDMHGVNLMFCFKSSIIFVADKTLINGGDDDDGDDNSNGDDDDNGDGDVDDNADVGVGDDNSSNNSYLVSFVVDLHLQTTICTTKHFY